MSEVFLSLGSNVDPAKNIPACISALKIKFDVKAVSSIYETDPVGPAGKNPFWNLAVVIETALDRNKLRESLAEIESTLGRKRDPQNKFAPRTIDIDTLPQNQDHEQGFIMVPLAEIRPKAIHAGTGKSYAELAKIFSTDKTLRVIRS